MITTDNKPDFLGIAVSGLCVLHCAFTPLLFAAQPLWHDSVGTRDLPGYGAWWWGSLDYLFLGLSLVAVRFAARASQRTGVRTLLWLGWVVFVVGLLLEGYSVGTWVMYFGSAVLVATHLMNFRQCRGPQPNRT